METIIAELQQRMSVLETKLNRQEKAFRKLKKEMVPESERKPRKPSGFAKPTYLSPALCTFLKVETGSELARTEVTKRLLAYVKDNNLQNSENHRVIDCDQAMTTLLSPPVGEDVTYFNIQRLLKGHYIKTDDTVPVVVEPPVVTVTDTTEAKPAAVKKTRAKKTATK